MKSISCFLEASERELSVSSLSVRYISLFLFVCFVSFQQSYKPIVEFIDAQFEAYLQEELKIKRVLHNYHDTRIHACLYFIAPTGHSLKSLDLVTMKKLDSKVGTFNSSWAEFLFNMCVVKRAHLSTLNSPYASGDDWVGK